MASLITDNQQSATDERQLVNHTSVSVRSGSRADTL